MDWAVGERFKFLLHTGGVVMSGINKAILVGNLGADPEVRHTQSGTTVANFRMATSEVFNDRSGERQTRTEWHRIVAFGRLGEICGQYLKKGKQVYVEGRIQTRSWEDRDGNTRYTTEIVARQMQMLGRVGDVPAGNEDAQEPPSDDDSQAPAEEEEDDLPF